ncbi:methyltransferase [Mucilaginibacter rubeus]|uniref:Methyltransferase n=1 Tax=Mucilaginibacter rubeus TaxID=2027860 RepID=A0AAE6JKL0_9SPHI|nr:MULTISPECIES: methyltransferase [Mucilaginibacter]QEM06332.1 methyltransferase [Mucilaginibacter rubeus]QEM18913.1 methyltransferase [Mucilaginibacter gossypii]QTE44544.1 methyltransferase [Mucilaginibacter rubeus]QTE51142.1 methyltransferase [Mucilaginibacter rubeus]QTE56228.1 methyltransferase [Mucilaginibacter rubeus]
MEQQPNQPSPENIMKIGTGFWPSKILLTAVNFQLFTRLAEKKTMKANDIKNILGLKCTDRNVYDFLDALTIFGCLKREGILDTAIYSNTPDTDTFLDKNKPSYIGGILEMMNNRLYAFWGSLGEGLLTGLPQNEIKKSEDFFGLIYSDPEKLKGFINAMSGIQMGNFMAFAQKFDFTQYKTLIDVGGSAGLLSLMVARHNAHMRCTSFDLPPVEPVANATIQQFGLSDQVKTASGDFFTMPIPNADVVVMGNILHDWDEENKISLMKKAYDALPANGAFVAIENIIDDERKQNVFGMMMSLNMLIETGTGFDYTFADFNGWANIAGFKSTSIIPLTGPSSAAIAYK